VHEEYSLVPQKAPLELKQHQVVKEIKPVPFAIVELRWSESIRQVGS